DEPVDTVIDQIPLPGKETSSGEKVYLLVTESPNEKKANATNADLIPKETLIGMPLPFVVDYLQRKKFPYQITEIKKPEFREMSGLVSNLEVKPTGVKIQAYYLKPSTSLLYDYELIEYELDDDDVYSANLSYMKPDGETEIQKEILSQIPMKEDEPVRFLVYRGKQSKLTLTGKNSKVVKVWKLEGKY
ncbi:hypothetical protein P3G55_16460, partial [Leptospira sp. 96542]|nr:hypothetical protein [Leptospira sp. 96542]